MTPLASDRSSPSHQAPNEWALGERALHWLSAALIVGMLALGLVMTHAAIDAGEAFDLYQRHKSFGFVVLALTALRLLMRLRRARPPFPPGMRPIEVALAKMTHGLFYALLFGSPLLGWLMVSSAPLQVPTRLFDMIPVPHLTAPNEAVYNGARLLHRLAAWTLIGLILLHVAAALKHHLVDRDATLRRMLFRWRAAS